MSNEDRVSLIQHGENVTDNMERLYTDNIGLIHQVASKYDGYADHEDLLQQGFLALSDAVKRYDPNRGMKFSTFFVMVYEQNINEYLALTGQCVRVPVNVRHQLKEYHTLLGRGLSLGEIAEQMDLSLRRVQELASLDAAPASLSFEIGEGLELIERLTSEPEEEKKDLSAVWDVVENTLDVKKTQIIIEVYQNGASMDALADQYGISHQAISEHHRKALERLHRSRKMQQLAEQADIDVYHGCGAGTFRRTFTSSVEFAVLRRDRIKKEEEAVHKEWLQEFEAKKAAFFAEYGLNKKTS